jgi:polynucleotide kinase-phosphatase
MDSRPLDVPDPSLVVLVGPSGSGKSAFAARHFAPTQVLSSDRFRGMVADDENDQSASADAFELLHLVATKRLAAGRLTVVDATNVRSRSRREVLRLAREHDVPAVAIVLDLPVGLCVQRNVQRAERVVGADVVRRHGASLRDSVNSLEGEGFHAVHVLRRPSEVDAVEVVRHPLPTDRRDDTGPFDVIGDVHGCRDELEALLGRLGYRIRYDDRSRAVDAEHADGRKAVLLGDLVDRGPDSAGALRLAMGMAEAGSALVLAGNHEDKLLRALKGHDVRTSRDLAESLEQIAAEGAQFQHRVQEFCAGLQAHLVLDRGRLVVAHAGLRQRYHGRWSRRAHERALYGETTGETDEHGLPVRIPLAAVYRGSATVLYGHTPVPEVERVNRTTCLDTGCAFGGALSALRYPEDEVVSVPAQRSWSRPGREPTPLSEQVREYERRE